MGKPVHKGLKGTVVGKPVHKELKDTTVGKPVHKGLKGTVVSRKLLAMVTSDYVKCIQLFLNVLIT